MVQAELVERLQAYLAQEVGDTGTQTQGKTEDKEETTPPQESTDRNALKKLTVPKLKEELKRRGQDDTGKKV